MKIKEIAFTCYAVTDVKRARHFYEKILGLKPASVFEKGSSAFIEYEIGHHTLAIGAGAPTFSPGKSGATVAFEVDDFDGFIKKLKAEKVPFVMEPYESPVCHMLLVSDPDGNQMMIHKRKEK